MNIRIYDPQTNLIHYPYAYWNGQRIAIASSLLADKGFGPHVLRTRETLVINENMRQEMEKYGSHMLVPANPEKSAVYVPLVTGDIGTRWYDAKAELLHFLYQYEHGVRLSIPPNQPRPGGIFFKLVQMRQPVVANSRAEYAAQGIKTVAGTDQSHSTVAVPILGSDRVLGFIAMEDYERENAFGEAEVRLLTTVAASMGVALENARLFDETQRLLKETEQRNAELAVIDRIRQGVAGSVDFQGIVDLVGDQLREVLR